MALTRKLLKGMGLTDEQVDTIIEAHTDTVDGLKADIGKYNPMQMISQFPQFMQQMRGQDPQQLLNQLVQSGHVNQQQLNQAQQMAQQMQGQFEQFRGMFGFGVPRR